MQEKKEKIFFSVEGLRACRVRRLHLPRAQPRQRDHEGQRQVVRKHPQQLGLRQQGALRRNWTTKIILDIVLLVYGWVDKRNKVVQKRKLSNFRFYNKKVLLANTIKELRLGLNQLIFIY